MNDDLVQMWLGTGPQLDGLGHLGEAGEFYNCNRGKAFSKTTGLTKLDISQIPPMVARGVLIDMAKYFDVEHLEAGQPFSRSEVAAALLAVGAVLPLYTTDRCIISVSGHWHGLMHFSRHCCIE